MRYRSTHRTLYSARYHLTWCSNYCRRVLVGGIDTRLKAIIAEVGAEVEVELMPYHVNLLTVGGAPLAVVHRYGEHQQAASRR
jgi:putative transposase